MPEVKWVFMVVVIGALYMSKTKSTSYLGRYGPSQMDNSKGVVVYRQPSTLVGSHKAFAPIPALDLREADRTEEFKLMRSMNPEQRKAYFAKAGLMGKF